jgi:hypothetical protein
MYFFFNIKRGIKMKELTINEITQVNGAGILGELINIVSGAALGCATASVLFSGSMLLG